MKRSSLLSRHSAATLLLFVAASSAVLWAQITPPSIPAPGQNKLPANTRVIEGTVENSDGSPVKGAVVLLKDMKSLQVRSYLAQDDGKYHFFGLSTDVNYQVRAQNGTASSSNKLVSVFDSHQRITIDLKLKANKKKN